MDPKQTRGYRNRNPGNIDWNAANDWQGQVGRETTGSPPRFAVFESHEFGVRALCALLTTYQKRYGLRTVEAIINRWCPPQDDHAGSQDTEAYVAHVCLLTGFKRDQRIDLKLFSDAKAIVTAIITHELGGNPYDAGEIDDGLELYGLVESVAKPVETFAGAASTGTGQAALTVAGVATAAATAAPGIQAFAALPQGTGVVLVIAVVAVAALLILHSRRSAAA
ncbi:MAG TPA: structural protein [Roseomonas sp.]|jgi:hypothetical protein